MVSTQYKSARSAVTVRICMFMRSRKNLQTCKLPLAGSRSPLVNYARGSQIGFHSTSQTRSCALRMPRYITFTAGLFSLWLTGDMLTLFRRADDCLSSCSSWTRVLLHDLVFYKRKGLLDAASSSHGTCKEVWWEDQRLSSWDFLK